MQMNQENINIDSYQNYNKILTFSIYIIAFFLILSPSFKILEGFPAIRLEEIYILLLICFLLINIFIGQKCFIIINKFVFLFIIFYLITAISILSGSVKGYDVSLFDFNQFIMLTKFLIIYIIGITTNYLNKENPQFYVKFSKYILTLSIFLFLLCMQQYFNIFNINQYYIPKIAPSQFGTLINNYPVPRPVGMIGNPNELGFLFCLLSLYSLYFLLRNKFSLYYFVGFTMQVMGLFFTLSRASLVAFAAGALLIIFLSIFNKKLGFKKLINGFFVFLISGVFVYYILNFTPFLDKIWWRFQELLNLDESNSWNSRLYNWSENMDIISDNIIIGVGPLSRASFTYAADNEWLLLLRSYGIIGTSFLVLNFIVLFKYISGKYKILILSMLFSGILYMIPAVFFNSLVLMSFFMLIAGIFSTSSNKIHIKYKSKNK